MFRSSSTLVLYVGLIGGLIGITYSDSYDATSSFCGFRVSPADADKINVSFTLYNRKESNGEQLQYDNLSSTKFNKDLRTVVLVHGYQSSPNAKWFGRVKEALLKKGDCNVVFVDWSKGAGGSLSLPGYIQAARNTEVVGGEIATLCNSLMETLGADFSKFHLVGFSLGAHVAGFAGLRFQVMTKKSLPRITGLDPAGLCFEGAESSMSLDKGDADFVDVIHTGCNGGGLGIRKSIGHADFYPSGCKIQPGCLFDFSGCNHKRAPELFIDSIENDHIPIMGSLCPSYNDKLYSKCPSQDCTKLGYYASPTAEPRIYCLKTSSRPPFGRLVKFRYWIFK